MARGGLIRPRQRNNNYGFTMGGPVIIPELYDGRNRTFFFFKLGSFRNRSAAFGAATTVPTWPTAAEILAALFDQPNSWRGSPLVGR